ncbi:MAG: right-handed parallel beta-helix repeat-containing protein, partial [Methanosarcinales archaeon]|nr:right-handed parallel beta-helix repeat-containing protein [Methanosarcinales archaeon]
HMAGVWNSAITNNKIHSNTGSVCGCGGGGNGIFTYGGDSPAYLGDDNTITYNHLYDNEKSGFFSKKKCANNIVSYNNVTGNRAGGITLRCANTDNTIVEYNYIADNLGAGIYFRATNNIIRYNTVVNNKDGSPWVSCGSPTNAICDDGVGIEVQDGAANAQIYDNIVCDNDARDIEDRSGELTGDDNTCDTTSNYDDDGTTGCTFSCSPPEKPDLAITAKSETLTGSTFKVTYTVKNTGGGDAGASTTGIYVDGTQIATDLVGALTAGASHTSTVTIDPFNCPCGTTVTVKVCADRDGAVDESDETNNCLENAFSCPSCAPPEEPDLTITAKSETLTDSTLEVTYTVANNGGVAAGASTTGIYAGSTQIATDSVGALTAGASHTKTVTIGSFDCPCGTTVMIKVCADEDDAVDESDETNNCLENAFSCPSCPGEPQLNTTPDLPSHNFGSVQQGPWTFDVTNCGGGTLEWTVSDDQSWITVSPTSGTETGTVTVMINTAGLSDGTHTVTVTVDSNGGTKTGTISVNVHTSSPPPSPPANVPTFTPIGMFAMVGLLGIAGMSAIRRR